MYERFYRLRERPFALTPDPDYLYPSRVHKEALSYLRYGIESHAGFVVITGAIGSGKTTLLQTLVRGLDSQTTVARVMNTLLDPRELLEAAMIDVGLDPTGKSKPIMLKEFGEFLVNERAAGRLVLLVIDEAQNLTLPALEEIRMLSNLETEKSKLLQIILIGQPDLRDKLDRPELEQLRQRITVSYHLEALDAEETSRYINHRLQRAAVGAPMEFERAGTDRIHARSGGVPRLINVIADATLVFGYGEERSEIDAALIDDVIADLDATGVLGPRSNPNRHASVVPADPAAAAVAMQGVGAVIDPNGAQLAAAATAAAVMARTAEDEKRARELADRESQMRAREADIAGRERELAEQRRVLAEQYRLLRSHPLEGKPAAAATGAAPGTSSGGAAAWPPAPRPQAPSYMFQPRRRSSFWRRVKQTLLGTPEPILEDSL
ncbi:MAG TPA: AAA family ATPase [Vicinamibacterales bacterium]|jgi:putative secretion ATPase (PEP-CTERM system associated)|nr:AAA family ATPase [Vicinamibacterales bacterium]